MSAYLNKSQEVLKSFAEKSQIFDLHDLRTFIWKLCCCDLLTFPQIFLDWKAESADFFAFRMYECDMALTWTWSKGDFLFLKNEKWNENCFSMGAFCCNDAGTCSAKKGWRQQSTREMSLSLRFQFCKMSFDIFISH